MSSRVAPTGLDQSVCAPAGGSAAPELCSEKVVSPSRIRASDGEDEAEAWVMGGRGAPHSLCLMLLE